MKRNHQYIVSKTGHNYELDRSLWTKYANFRKMYGKVEEARIESNVAVRLPSPQRQVHVKKVILNVLVAK